jgi:hypothetical protein
MAKKNGESIDKMAPLFDFPFTNANIHLKRQSSTHFSGSQWVKCKKKL